ncbi:PEP-CTERM sorting domain-containing protein [Oleiagrimonas sp.]|jgi:hypothetical protein|uniref:PEP-CTERM sorting domain-containing protein n=1 Tax=Oleiagrimonas sp. TaxID=2010330 RepID=UPI00260720CB|nr:PEP-CTERM sorting domain-containing protein [Oleiagrimonas sp.]MDA3914712.1 PEP-CTERM sorting domain-containing protein [Oleiagrimonas sp.]
MYKHKYLGLLGLIAASLFATQAFATTCPTAPAGPKLQTQGAPVCLAPYGSDGSGTGLHDVLGPSTNPSSIFSSGPGVNPYTQQTQTPFWSVNASSGSISTILLQIAGNAGNDTFGIFDPNNANNKLALITNGSNGDQAALSTYAGGGYAVNFGTKVYFSTTNYFGYYLATPTGTFYSLPSLNAAGGMTYPNGMPHMVAYHGDGGNTLQPMNGFSGGTWSANEYILAWEDQPFAKSDLDYNDFLVMVESVHPVPEPAVLGMFGLGLLLIGGFAVSRRRRYNV